VARTGATALLALSGVIAAVSLSPALAQSAGKTPPADLVKLELVADRAAVGKSGTLTLAARFAIAPGWHIYWENPGEAGLATEVSFVAPAGYEVGPVRYPGPVRFQTPGETAASFGYTDAAMLSSEVKVKKAAAAPARFTVQASWLACRDVCIRGKGTASLELPIEGRAKPAHADLFERHQRELPRKFAELRAKPRWERDAKSARLLVAIDKAERAEYFPPTGEDLQLVGQAWTGAKGAGELRLDYKPGTKPARARGVLAVTNGGERRYYALDLQEAP
jgi:DsbC/DsbD-like thiol-disulfide interchange protein